MTTSPDEGTCALSAEPLRILICAIECMSRLVVLVLAELRGLCGLRQKCFDVGGLHRPETLCGGQRLVEYPHGVAARNHDARWQIHGVVQALDRGGGFALKNDVVAHWLHSQHADIVLHQHRQDVLLEAVVMRRSEEHTSELQSPM